MVFRNRKRLIALLFTVLFLFASAWLCYYMGSYTVVEVDGTKLLLTDRRGGLYLAQSLGKDFLPGDRVHVQSEHIAESYPAQFIKQTSISLVWR